MRVMAGSQQHELFNEVVRLCGLSSLLGPGTVRRALKEVGATQATATVEHYKKALDQLEARIAIYRGSADAADAVKRIKEHLNEA
jgi:hypothetical protein